MQHGLQLLQAENPLVAIMRLPDDFHFLAEDLLGEGLLRLRAERLLALGSVDMQEANLVRLLVEQDVDRVAVRDLDDLAPPIIPDRYCGRWYTLTPD